MTTVNFVVGFLGSSAIDAPTTGLFPGCSFGPSVTITAQAVSGGTSQTQITLVGADAVTGSDAALALGSFGGQIALSMVLDSTGWIDSAPNHTGWSGNEFVPVASTFTIFTGEVFAGGASVTGFAVYEAPYASIQWAQVEVFSPTSGEYTVVVSPPPVNLNCLLGQELAPFQQLEPTKSVTIAENYGCLAPYVPFSLVQATGYALGSNNNHVAQLLGRGGSQRNGRWDSIPIGHDGVVALSLVPTPLPAPTSTESAVAEFTAPPSTSMQLQFRDANPAQQGWQMVAPGGRLGNATRPVTVVGSGSPWVFGFFPVIMRQAQGLLMLAALTPKDPTNLTPEEILTMAVMSGYGNFAFLDVSDFDGFGGNGTAGGSGNDFLLNDPPGFARITFPNGSTGPVYDNWPLPVGITPVIDFNAPSFTEEPSADAECRTLPAPGGFGCWSISHYCCPPEVQMCAAFDMGTATPTGTWTPLLPCAPTSSGSACGALSSSQSQTAYTSSKGVCNSFFETPEVRCITSTSGFCAGQDSFAFRNTCIVAGIPGLTPTTGPGFVPTAADDGGSSFSPTSSHDHDDGGSSAGHSDDGSSGHGSSSEHPLNPTPNQPTTGGGGGGGNIAPYVPFIPPAPRSKKTNLPLLIGCIAGGVLLLLVVGVFVVRARKAAARRRIL